MQYLTEAAGRFSAPEIALLCLNICLLLAAPVIVRRLSAPPIATSSPQARLRIFRLLNLLPITLLIGANLVFPEASEVPLLRWIAVLLVLYLSHLGFHITVWIIRARFCKQRSVGDEIHLVETYNSRMLILLAAALFSIIAVLASIQLLQFNSLLQAGGVLGFIGVMLALTQASWAPDLISGLIVLNSRMIEEGDVIQIESPLLVAMVFKTKMFHTELINLANDHRIMVRNHQLRNRDLHNLSKFASPRGLRECLLFNIGYEISPSQVRALFDDAWARAQRQIPGVLELQHPPQIRLMETGDHALTWGWFYHTRSVRSVLSTRQSLRELALAASVDHGISLATPKTVSLQATAPEN